MKYGKKDENGSFYSFLVDRLMINMNYYPWWATLQQVEKEIEVALRVLKKRGFKPLDIDNLIPEFEEAKELGQFLPKMSLIKKEMKKQYSKEQLKKIF